MPMNTEYSKARHREQVAKSHCVPLVWKEKARVSGENFSIETPILDPPLPPVNFQISVPFQWEEKPGKPRSFSAPRLDSILSCSPITSIREASAEGCDEDCEEEDGGERDDKDDLFELDLEAFAFDENDLPVQSFSASTTAFLANCMSTLSGISNITAVDHLPSETDENSCRGSDQEASSSEGDSSYIEFIFPLASPRSYFLQEVIAADNRLSDVSGHGSRRQSCCRVSWRRKPKTKSANIERTDHASSLVKRKRPIVRVLMFMSRRVGRSKREATANHRNSHGSWPRKHRAVCCPFRNGSGSREKKEDKQP